MQGPLLLAPPMVTPLGPHTEHLEASTTPAHRAQVTRSTGLLPVTPSTGPRLEVTTMDLHPQEPRDTPQALGRLLVPLLAPLRHTQVQMARLAQDLRDLVSGRESTVSFGYVRGRYFLRLVRVISEGGGTCEEGSFSSCSSMCGRMVTWGQAGPGECGNSSSSDMEVIINQSYQDTEQVCTFELDISLAVCHAIQPYSRVNVSNVEVPLNFSCASMDLLDWDNFEVTSP